MSPPRRWERSTSVDISQVRAIRDRIDAEFGDHPNFSSIGIAPDRSLHVNLYAIDPELELSILAITGPHVKFHTVERQRASSG